MQEKSTSRKARLFPLAASCRSLTDSLKESIRSNAEGFVFSAVRFARPVSWQETKKTLDYQSSTRTLQCVSRDADGLVEEVLWILMPFEIATDKAKRRNHLAQSFIIFDHCIIEILTGLGLGFENEVFDFKVSYI